MDRDRGADGCRSRRQRISVTGSPLVALPWKLRAFAGELRQRLAVVVAHHQAALLVGPFAAGEELAGAAALGRDRAFGGGGRRPRRTSWGIGRGPAS